MSSLRTPTEAGDSSRDSADSRVDEEMINYRNRMDSFISCFITVPPAKLLRKKHIEVRRECLSRLLHSSPADMSLVWDLEMHIFLFYELIERSFYGSSCRRRQTPSAQ